ncbi:MAG TPA: RNA-binding protein [Cyanobacteria bacterium UBA11369]|nr:RNA-binding protein [Cyanobacteria bacterium UBA11371]HBE33943.1 RNA-binding protein [Cyanobacteria bacterium UBA11368]HBE53230.1 RNA-binding protein [Cyanobacteria bacterium UBA11369]
MSIRLYVGNLPKEEIDRNELQAVFAEAGNNISTKLIKDRKTGKCRGFGFVTVPNDEQADQFIEKFNGFMFRDSAIKIEKALPRAKGQQGEEEAKPVSDRPSTTPTPSTSNSGGGGGGGGGGGSSRRNNKKSRRPSGSTTSTSTSSDSVQPDPRWAQALEELKQRLAAQTTNP